MVFSAFTNLNISVILCWVSCDGLTSHPVAILQVTSCWISCDGLASYPGGSSNTPSHFTLGILRWTSLCRAKSSIRSPGRITNLTSGRFPEMRLAFCVRPLFSSTAPFPFRQESCCISSAILLVSHHPLVALLPTATIWKQYMKLQAGYYRSVVWIQV